MNDEIGYEAPAVTSVTPVDAPLVGTVHSGINPQWQDDSDVRDVRE